MNRSSRLHLLLVATLAGAAGCDHQRSSKYPGELGAPCSVDSDCKNGMQCSITHLPGRPLPFCFAPCANADSECPEGSLCDGSSVPDADGGTLRICYRRCETTDFCRDLNPAFNACKSFDLPYPVCGFRG